MGLVSVPLPVQAWIGLDLVTVLVEVFVEADALARADLIGSGRITPQHRFRSLDQWRLAAVENVSVEPAVGVRPGPVAAGPC